MMGMNVIVESQENAKIMRHHEAHGRFRLLRNTEEKQTPRKRASYSCNRSPMVSMESGKTWKKIGNFPTSKSLVKCVLVC